MKWKRRETAEWRRQLSRLLVLALFFFAGILLGQVFSSRVPDTTGDELARYLKDFLKVGEEDPSPRAALSAAVLYFRYPLAAFLLGFASIGVLALPIVTGAFGGFLSFSVCCFTASFGPDGVLLALAVFGLRCVVTLPCYFLLAVPALERSAALACLSLGGGRRAGPALYGREWWGRLAVVAGVLLAGVCADLMLTPWFLRQLLERMLIG
ncbi:stage II sporulation protein M [uncultured Oscillibacter sp.]|uniref:stage II sporulation protein M n=1 Tax=uncultured Oscillibacter sp. TaxID=876091 RepID=UPI0025D6E3B4|nr:stage II sporulation protein M [uncultured Oscillibacter sp.]